MQDVLMLIEGARTAAREPRWLEVFDPATGQPFARVPAGGAADVDRAVRAARAALEAPPWRRMSAQQRGRLLFEISRRVRAEREALAELETRNTGKPIAEARYDIDEVALTFEYYAGWATKISGEIPPIAQNAMSLLIREPVGVCGLITAWNYPLLLAAWKLAPALAAGCTVIVKPAEQTPLTTLALAGMMAECGLPAGVVNVVTGDGPGAGAPLVEHPGVDKISFTGSRAVGVEIMRRAAPTLKRLTLELGGKSPNIIFADAPFEQAIAGTSAGIFGNQGQICSAGSRVLVERRIHDRVVEALIAEASKIRVGNGLQPDVTMGPLVSAEQHSRVSRYAEIGRKEGARLAFSGTLPAAPGGGYYFAPTIFTGVTPTMTIAREEIFGPVMAVIPFDDEEQALQIANDTEYGLAAAVWTADMRRGLAFARQLRAGTVWINDAQISPIETSWGGFKQSGFGRELGRAGVDAYLEQKQIYLNLDARTAGQTAP